MINLHRDVMLGVDAMSEVPTTVNPVVVAKSPQRAPAAIAATDRFIRNIWYAATWAHARLDGVKSFVPMRTLHLCPCGRSWRVSNRCEHFLVPAPSSDRC